MMAKALLPFNYIILLVCLLTLSPTLHVFKEFRWPPNYLLHTNGGAGHPVPLKFNPPLLHPIHETPQRIDITVFRVTVCYRSSNYQSPHHHQEAPPAPSACGAKPTAAGSWDTVLTGGKYWQRGEERDDKTIYETLNDISHTPHPVHFTHARSTTDVDTAVRY